MGGGQQGSFSTFIYFFMLLGGGGPAPKMENSTFLNTSLILCKNKFSWNKPTFNIPNILIVSWKKVLMIDLRFKLLFELLFQNYMFHQRKRGSGGFSKLGVESKFEDMKKKVKSAVSSSEDKFEDVKKKVKSAVITSDSERFDSKNVLDLKELHDKDKVLKQIPENALKMKDPFLPDFSDSIIDK